MASREDVHGVQEYQGTDRRAAGRLIGVQSGRVVVSGVVAGIVMLLASAGLVTLVSPTAHSLWALAIALWCMAVLGSGLVMLGAWRIGGRAFPARLGTGLVLAAMLIPLIPLVVDASVPQGQVRSAKALALTVVFSVAGWLVARSTGGAQVETGLRPLRRLAALAAVTTAIAVVLVALFLTLDQPPDPVVRYLPSAVCLLYAVWALLAGPGNTAAVAFRSALPLSLALLAFALAVHRMSDSAFGMVLVATALATSAGLLVGVAGELLRAALRRQDVRSLSTMASLAQFQTAAERDRERRHDALSALSAIRSASGILTSNGADLDAGTRAELVGAVRAELSRVERMLATSGSAPVLAVDVDVADALSPLLLAWRHRGLVVEGPEVGFVVHVEPDALVQIINNLLHNAHRHAPGSAVRLMVDDTDDSVHISVIDGGPGIPPQRRVEVLETGARLDPATGGSGLGLASARRLAEGQRGELRLLDVDDGCWFVLSLPRSDTRANDQLSDAPGHAG